MTPSDYASLQQRFLELRERGPDERERELAMIGELRPEFERQLRDLLESDDNPSGFLEPPFASLMSSRIPEVERQHSDPALQSTFTPNSTANNEDAPEQIGPYRILQKIGEGGHGLVFMAEQRAPIRRKVAIKLIRPGMESKMILARFEAERQALALMKHPSIANVIDAGTSESGRPYFVMELVHGTPIHQFCKDNQLTLTATLKLFQQVCDAVHHAHRKGVIHRDIKPANVLVTVDSGRPLPKVIDFGIAKAMHLTLTERTMFTEFGQIVGTLEYMSPEQALMSQDQADVRSDVYSLGVLLYVLLTDSPPISRKQLLQKGLIELRSSLNDIRPPTPSLRLSESRQARPYREQIAGDARQWSQKLKGDLDWITMKALEKDLNQRYDSAAALRDDIERFLTHDEVLARPPSLRYRLSRWVRRHKAAATVFASILACMIISFAAVSWGLFQSQQNLKESERQRERADKNAGQLAKQLKRGILERAWILARDGNRELAKQELQKIPSADRGDGWKFVDAIRRNAGPLILRQDSEGPLREFAVHDKSGRFAVITDASKLEIRQLETGQLVSTRQLPKRLYTCLEFDSAGGQLLLGYSDHIRLLSLQDETLSEEIPHRLGGTRSAVFHSPGNSWFITTGANWIVKVNAVDQKVEQRHRLSERVDAIASFEDSEQIAVAGLDGTCFFALASDIANVLKITGAQSELIGFQKMGTQIKAVSRKGVHYEVSLPAVESRQPTVFGEISKAGIRNTQVTDATIISNDWTIFSLRDGSIELQADQSSPLIAHRFATAIDEHRLTKAGLVIRHFDGRVTLLNKSDLIRSLNSLAARDVTDALPLPKESATLTTHADGTIRQWNLTNGGVSQARQLHTAEIFTIDRDPDRNLLASFGSDWRIRITDIESLKEVRSWAVSGGVRPLCFAHQGQFVAGAPNPANLPGLREGTIDLWDVTQGRSIQRFNGHQNWVIQLLFSPDDTLLYSLSVDGTLRVWDIATGRQLHVMNFEQSAPVIHFALTADSQQILCGHDDGSMSLQDLQTGTTICRRRLFPNRVNQLALLPGMKIAVVLAADSVELVLVDVNTFEPVCSLNPGIGRINGFRRDRQNHQLHILGETGGSQMLPLPHKR